MLVAHTQGHTDAVARRHRAADIARSGHWGSDVNSRNGNGETRLFDHVWSPPRSGSGPNHVLGLLRQGVDVNAQRVGGKTALMLACSRVNLRMVRALLAAPPPQVADVDGLRDQFGNTAMDYALASCGGTGTAEQRAATAAGHPVVLALLAHIDAHGYVAVPAAEAAGAAASCAHARCAGTGTGTKIAAAPACATRPGQAHQLDAWRPCAAMTALGSSDTGDGSSSSSSSSSDDDDDDGAAS
jgi:hypothetical protein